MGPQSLRNWEWGPLKAAQPPWSGRGRVHGGAAVCREEPPGTPAVTTSTNHASRLPAPPAFASAQNMLPITCGLLRQRQFSRMYVASLQTRASVSARLPFKERSGRGVAPGNRNSPASGGRSRRVSPGKPRPPAARAPGGCGLYVRSREVIPSRNRLTNPVSQRSSPWRPHVAERHTEVAGGSRPPTPSLLTRSHGLRRGLCRAGTHSPGPTARALGCGCCPWVTLGGRAGGGSQQGHRTFWAGGGRPCSAGVQVARPLRKESQPGNWRLPGSTSPKGPGGNTDLAEALHSDPKRPETLPQRGLRLSPCHAPLLQVLTPRLRQ